MNHKLVMMGIKSRLHIQIEEFLKLNGDWAFIEQFAPKPNSTDKHPEPPPTEADPPGDPRRSGHGGGERAAALEAAFQILCHIEVAADAEARGAESSEADDSLSSVRKSIHIAAIKSVQVVQTLKELIASAAAMEPEESGA